MSQRVGKCPTIPTPLTSDHFCAQNCGKIPKHKRDTTCKFLAVTCPPGNQSASKFSERMYSRSVMYLGYSQTPHWLTSLQFCFYFPGFCFQKHFFERPFLLFRGTHTTVSQTLEGSWGWVTQTTETCALVERLRAVTVKRRRQEIYHEKYDTWRLFFKTLV